MSDCYAQRVLNPFRGCMQVIRHQAAEAVSMDGLLWDIYVRNDSLLTGAEGETGPVQVSETRFGRWSAETGLKRGPLHPSEDFYRMERMGMVVYEQLRQWHERVPFPFRDRYERWLVDKDDKPLVLVDSAVRREDARSAGESHWRIGLAAQAQFASPALEACGAPRGKSAGEFLMDYINGLGPRACWFHREPDGSGIRLEPAGNGATRLTAEAFPSLLLRGDGHPEPQTRLIADFIAWQAPWLLLLDGLDKDTRARLERRARNRAAEVAKLYRLYPEMIDPAQVQAARVEARLTQARPNASAECGDDMSTFYIELNPGGDS